MSTARGHVKRHTGNTPRAADQGAVHAARIQTRIESGAGKPPQQARSKARVARILKASNELVQIHGVTGLTMSSVARKAKIPIGSLYQYFPSKSELVARLFLNRLHSYHDLVVEVTTGADTPEQCARALGKLVYEIYEANRADPLMRDIWGGIQADRDIRNLHVKDNEYYQGFLAGLAERAGTTLRGEALKLRVIVINEMLDATIRLAISLNPSKARALLNDAVSVATRELGFRT